MSAHDQVRAMLDELMGTARDGNFLMRCSAEIIEADQGQARSKEKYLLLLEHEVVMGIRDASRCQMKFDDPRVCKSFLLGCCPHDILASTRMDLGDCPKYHDLALRADYEAASKKKDYFYDIDAMEHLQNFIAECDRKTEMYKRRLKETQEELSEEANSKAEAIHQLGEEIGTKLAHAEGLGAEGKVDESMKLMNEVEELKKKKALAETEYKNSMPASSYQQQKLRVCEICSAYLGIHDNDRRLADHFGGKLHLGFITIRDKLTELKSTHAERIMQRGEERERQRQRREEERKRDDDDRSHRSRSRSRRRSRSRSRSRRDRSRSRSRRSRSRSRHSRKKSRRRSRSRSRTRRSRSRSRKRSSRRSRSRSRSRTRRHRSRSRSRGHKKSKRRSRSRSRSKRRSKSVENGATHSPEPGTVDN